jgi:hypothetical protein
MRIMPEENLTFAFHMSPAVGLVALIHESTLELAQTFIA